MTHKFIPGCPGVMCLSSGAWAPAGGWELTSSEMNIESCRLMRIAFILFLRGLQGSLKDPYFSSEKYIYFNISDTSKPKPIADRSDETSIVVIKVLFQFWASEVNISERALPSFTNNSKEQLCFIFAACKAFLHSLGRNFLELCTGNRACVNLQGTKTGNGDSERLSDPRNS